MLVPLDYLIILGCLVWIGAAAWSAFTSPGSGGPDGPDR